MRELMRTNDAVLVSAVAALLDGAAIPHLVFDQNMSVLEGSIGILARREPDIRLTLVEIDPDLAALAAANAELNGLAASVTTVVLDVAATSRALTAAGLMLESAARVLMNPPFNDPQRERSSPDRRRRLAHAAPREDLAAWIRTAGRLL